MIVFCGSAQKYYFSFKTDAVYLADYNIIKCTFIMAEGKTIFEKTDNGNDFCNLDVLFFIPPVFRIMGQKWEAYPLGMGYLVSTLDQIKIKSAIYYSNYLEIDECPPNIYFLLYLSKKWEEFYSVVKEPENEIWKEITYVLEKTKPKVVCLGSCIVDLPSLDMVIRLIKAYDKDIPIVVGGPSATTYYEKLIQNPSIDYLVIGEGEQTIRELIPLLLNKPVDAEKVRKIEGIIFRQGNTVIQTEKRELISNLDEIPFPNREKVFYVEKNKELKKLYLIRDILLSRGCPFNCKFCSAFTVWGTRKPRFRSKENIIEEIKLLKSRYNQTFFVFWDDLFTSNRKRVIDFCNALIEYNLNITWLALARIDTIDEELLLLMKKAGCVQIQFGIESGSDRILKLVNKGISVSQVIEKAKIIRKCNIPWSTFWVIGFPTETEDEIYDTLKLIDTIDPTMAELSVFSPYPGTEFYTELLQSGHISDESDRCDASYFEKNYTLNIPAERFKEIAIHAFNHISRHNNKKSILVNLRYANWLLQRKISELKKTLKNN